MAFICLSFLLFLQGRSSLGQSGSIAEDAMAAAEEEVASLMEEDMGVAMQFLQSKGLCLMPISLASAISDTNARSLDGQLQMGSLIPSYLTHTNNNITQI
jgi:hypothetical protein